jgi:DNA-directed RNA polymerase specialized sigma24 family protein
MNIDIHSYVCKAATGDTAAFTEIVLALNQDLRTWMAGFATHKAMVDTAEREVWSHLRREILSGVPEQAMTDLVFEIGTAVLTRLLQSVQSSNQNDHDALLNILAIDGQVRLLAPAEVKNNFVPEILAQFEQLPSADRSLMLAIHVEHTSLLDLAETLKIPLTDLATRCFTIRRLIWKSDITKSDEATDSQLALLIGCHLDGSIIPTDLLELQQRVSTCPADATMVTHQIRAFILLSVLLDPPTPAMVRELASELFRNNNPRSRSDSSMLRAVDRASFKAKRIPFAGLPPPPPPPTKTPSLWPMFIIASGLIISGVIALTIAW